MKNQQKQKPIEFRLTYFVSRTISNIIAYILDRKSILSKLVAITYESVESSVLNTGKL